MKTDRSRVLLALGSLYVIWGSTFLGIRIALEGYPPLMLAGIRFAIAGGLLYVWVRARGAPPPTRTQWRSSLIVGTLLTCANACVVIAEQWVSSGVAAVAIASVPLWVALMAGLHGERITAVPSLRSTAALGYLIVAGSLIGYSAYQFLLSRVRPTLAASYAYVNPVVAVGLGAAVAGESVAPRAVGALALILGGVAMLAIHRQAA